MGVRLAVHFDRYYCGSCSMTYMHGEKEGAGEA